jgi:hypothetical protein
MQDKYNNINWKCSLKEHYNLVIYCMFQKFSNIIKQISHEICTQVIFENDLYHFLDSEWNQSNY